MEINNSEEDNIMKEKIPTREEIIQRFNSWKAGYISKSQYQWTSIDEDIWQTIRGLIENMNKMEIDEKFVNQIVDEALMLQTIYVRDEKATRNDIFQTIRFAVVGCLIKLGIRVK
jgi:hypothetical protein